MFHRPLLIVVLALLGFALAPSLHAHNGGILIQLRDGKLDLGADSEQTGLPPDFDASVFSTLLNSANYSQDLPSYLSLATPPAGTEALPQGADIYWDFLPMSIGGMTSNLWYWNGGGASVESVDFGPVPQQGVTMSIYNIDDNQSATISGGDQLAPGALLGTTTTTDNRLRLHYHNYYLLDDGDGVLPTEVPEGAYLFAVRLRMAGVAPSDPLYLVAGTFPLVSSSLESIDAAMEWVELNRQQLNPAGDYNLDAVVDEQDFAVWQHQLGLESSSFTSGDWADGHGDGVIDLADYTVWRDNVSVAPPALAQSAVTNPVPEPTSVVIMTIGLGVLGLGLRRTF